jgi:hypothetical protein
MTHINITTPRSLDEALLRGEIIHIQLVSESGEIVGTPFVIEPVKPIEE